MPNGQSPSTESDLERVWSALASVHDPEIPVLSVVELGVVADATVSDGSVVVEMTPTFAGCPALDVMRDQMRHAVQSAGFEDVRVKVVFDPPWSSDRISPEGRRKLKEFGLAPPPACRSGEPSLASLARVTCPFCDSADTTLESMFGPTLCRAIHFCNSCLQSFEQFKPV